MYANDYRLLKIDLCESHGAVHGKLAFCDWQRAEGHAILEIVTAAMPLVAIGCILVALVLWRAA